jgi:hypothetical protein
MRSFFEQFCPSALAAIVAAWLTAWYTKQTVRTIITADGLRAMISAALPAWFVVLLVAALVWSVVVIVRQKKLLRETRSKASSEPPKPTLYASWRGDSEWGWASPDFVDAPLKTYMIRGDVTLLMDHISEPKYITGVEIDGAESVGTFVNFKLNPSQPEIRGMQVYFRGPAPQGNEYFSLQLVFKDVKGNRYPTAVHRFSPLPIPERIGHRQSGLTDSEG